MVTTWPTDSLEQVAACPVCGHAGGPVLHADLEDLVARCAPGRWALRACPGCGAGYLDPRPSPQSISLAYADYHTHSAPQGPSAGLSSRIRRGLKNGYLARRHGYDLSPSWAVGPLVLAAVPGARRKASRWVRHLDRPAKGASLLDVGCGNGAFLAEMREAGWEVQGTEPDEAAAAVARAVGVPVTVGLLEEGTFPPASFDVVTLHHVIEHVHDPVATLAVCRSLLKPSGSCWVATPNLCSEGHRRYGGDWRGLEPPRHLVVFTPGSLDLALASAGFSTRVPMPPGLDAPAMFAASEEISKAAPRIGPRKGPQPARWAPVAANLRARLQPERAEELVVLARP